MRLHFDAKIVKQLREHAATAAEHKSLYDQPDTKKPGFWLVGDQGVYLMSNGSPHLPKEPGASDEKSLVAYAKECNPETMDFDDWWEAKQRSFGGDDGVEFIDIASIPEHGRIIINMTATSFAILEVLS